MCGISTSELSVHDNHVYGFQCDSDKGILVLHSVFNEPANEVDYEYTDIVFKGVEVHRIVDVFRPQNVLFDIEIGDIKDLRDRVVDTDSFNEHGAYLSLADKKKCTIFHICSSNGMRGWVAGQSVELVKRDQRVKDICDI